MRRDGRETTPYVATGRNPYLVSVIVCCHTEKRLELIAKCLAALSEQTYKHLEIILVVDNNPALEESLKAFHFSPRIRLIFHRGMRGSAASRNDGVLAAKGECVAFIDDDAIPAYDWVEQVVSALGSSVVAAGGKAIADWLDGRPAWFPEELDWLVGGIYKGHPEEKGPVRNVYINNMLVYRSAYLSVGMLQISPDGGGGMIGGVFKGGEEADLCLRLRKRFGEGCIIYDPTAIVYHKVAPERVRLLQLFVRAYGEGISKAWMAQRLRSVLLNPLSTETAYLRYLLLKSIPSRLVHPWRPTGLAQAGALVVSLLATGTGYAVGSLRLRRHKQRRLDCSEGQADSWPQSWSGGT